MEVSTYSPMGLILDKACLSPIGKMDLECGISSLKISQDDLSESSPTSYSQVSNFPPLVSYAPCNIPDLILYQNTNSGADMK